MKIIARRNPGNNPQTGFITPVYFMSGSGTWDKVGNTEIRIDKFPNVGTVVIPRKFHEIAQNYNTHEFFLVEVEDSPNYEETIPNSCKFQSLDADASSVRKLPMLIKGSYSSLTDVYLPYSGHRYVFFEDGEYVFGPVSIFQAEQPEGEYEDFQYKTEPLNTEDLGLEDKFAGVVFKYRKNQLDPWLVKNQFGMGNAEEYYVYGIDEMISKISPEEYILTESDEEIREWSYSAFPENFSVDKLQDWLSDNDGTHVVDRMRFERFAKLKEKTTSWIKFVESYLSRQYILSEEGQQRIEQYIRNNTEELTKGYEKEFKAEIEKKMADLNAEVQQLESTSHQYQGKLRQLQEEIKLLQDEKELLYSKSEQVKEIEEQIKEKLEKLKIIQDYERVKEEYDKTVNAITYVTKSVDEKKRELEELQLEYTQKAKEGSHKRMLELMPYVQALTGYYPDEISQNKPAPLSHNLQQRLSEEPVDFDTYFTSAKTFLDSKGRILSEIEVANLLTCIHQNFLTIFSGLPGVGKSSLSRLLGYLVAPTALNLEIPVGHGWSTKKNLLGFYNSLKSEYQPDEFGILDKLKFLNAQPEMLKKVPFFVLLDEANLSPIEHYWADFLGACDQSSDRMVRINDPNGNPEIMLPDGFRFMFTINNDHTTELLSPRLIDRATIIKLEYDSSKNSELNFGDLNDSHAPDHFSYASIKSAFLPDSYSLNQTEKRLFSDILAILGEKDVKLGKQVPVSPRKIKAVTLYCSVIRKYFNKNHETQFLAMDFAILQNVLPLINGQGKNFEARLEKLKAECLKRSLAKTAQELDDIIARGREFQNYSFF